MKKNEFVAAVANKANITKKEAEVVVNVFLETLTEELVKGEEVQFVGFGSFAVKERAEREGYNPKTGEKLVVAASKAPVFKAGKSLKDAVNK